MQKNDPVGANIIKAQLKDIQLPLRRYQEGIDDDGDSHGSGARGQHEFGDDAPENRSPAPTLWVSNSPVETSMANSDIHGELQEPSNLEGDVGSHEGRSGGNYLETNLPPGPGSPIFDYETAFSAASCHDQSPDTPSPADWPGVADPTPVRDGHKAPTEVILV